VSPPSLNQRHSLCWVLAWPHSDSSSVEKSDIKSVSQGVATPLALPSGENSNEYDITGGACCDDAVALHRLFRSRLLAPIGLAAADLQACIAVRQVTARFWRP
jgi:hypothetical protein